MKVFERSEGSLTNAFFNVLIEMVRGAFKFQLIQRESIIVIILEFKRDLKIVRYLAQVENIS